MKKLITTSIAALSATWICAQTIYAPSTTIGTSTTQGVGVGTNTPLGTMDIRYNCVNNGLATLLVTGNSSTTSVCSYPMLYGDPFRVRTETTSGTYRNDFVIRGSNGNVGIGLLNPSFRVDITTSSANDGVRVTQTGASSAALRLDNSYTNGHNWGILSTSDGNTQLGGKLLFYDYSATSNRERMTIDGSGNVGIATYTPAVRLHVKTSVANDGFRLEQNGSGNAVLGLYNSTTGGRNWSLNATGNGSTQGAGNFMIKNETSGQADFFISGSSENVGIGTTNPVHGKLHIYASNGASGLCVEQNATSAYTYGMKVRVNMDQTKAISVFNTSDPDNPVEVMTIWGTGIINTPKVYAAELQVVPTPGGMWWPDFVFAPEYQLMPLSQVERYYKTNNHLPGVPTQCDVEENGINVAQMNAVLLQKVEELTLYVVQLQKEIDALQANQQTH